MPSPAPQPVAPSASALARLGAWVASLVQSRKLRAALASSGSLALAALSTGQPFNQQTVGVCLSPLLLWMLAETGIDVAGAAAGNRNPEVPSSCPDCGAQLLPASAKAQAVADALNKRG